MGEAGRRVPEAGISQLLWGEGDAGKSLLLRILQLLQGYGIHASADYQKAWTECGSRYWIPGKLQQLCEYGSKASAARSDRKPALTLQELSQLQKLAVSLCIPYSDLREKAGNTFGLFQGMDGHMHGALLLNQLRNIGAGDRIEGISPENAVLHWASINVEKAVPDAALHFRKGWKKGQRINSGSAQNLPLPPAAASPLELPHRRGRCGV